MLGPISTRNAFSEHIEIFNQSASAAGAGGLGIICLISSYITGNSDSHILSRLW